MPYNYIALITMKSIHAHVIHIITLWEIALIFNSLDNKNTKVIQQNKMTCPMST